MLLFQLNIESFGISKEGPELVAALAIDNSYIIVNFGIDIVALETGPVGLILYDSLAVVNISNFDIQVKLIKI